MILVPLPPLNWWHMFPKWLTEGFSCVETNLRWRPAPTQTSQKLILALRPNVKMAMKETSTDQVRTNQHRTVWAVCWSTELRLNQLILQLFWNPICSPLDLLRLFNSNTKHSQCEAVLGLPEDSRLLLLLLSPIPPAFSHRSSALFECKRAGWRDGF